MAFQIAEGIVLGGVGLVSIYFAAEVVLFRIKYGWWPWRRV